MLDEWAPPSKFRPSLMGHLRRTHVSEDLIVLQTQCIRACRDPRASAEAHCLRRTVDLFVNEIVMDALRDLELLYEELLVHRIWRRLMLWGRARVAARRVMARRRLPDHVHNECGTHTDVRCSATGCTATTGTE